MPRSQVGEWSPMPFMGKVAKLSSNSGMGGRTCHPLMNHGAIPVAPSAIAITNDEVHTPNGKVLYITPRALTDEEIPSIIAGFRAAAENTKTAGFDGVEIHGANGYLLDEFLRDGSNQCSGPYGGSVENRVRLLWRC